MSSSRPFGAATIVLGEAIRIPVKLHATVGDSKPVLVRAHAKCATKAQQKFHCPTCDEIVASDDFGKFVESGGRLLPLDADDLAEIEREPTHEMSALEAVPLADIPRHGALSSYFLMPDAGAEKPLGLLARVLWSESLALVVRWGGRGGERIACLYSPLDELASALVCEVRAWSEDLRSIEEIQQPETFARDAEFGALRKVVLAWSRGEFNPAEHEDRQRATVAAVVARVVERELVAGPKGLKAALKASVREQEPKAAPKRARRKVA